MGFCIQIWFSSKLLAAGRFAGINVSLVLTYSAVRWCCSVHVGLAAQQLNNCQRMQDLWCSSQGYFKKPVDCKDQTLTLHAFSSSCGASQPLPELGVGSHSELSKHPRVYFVGLLVGLLVTTSTCHILSHLVTSCHILSHLVTSCHILSHLVTSCHILSHLVTSCHILSHLVTSCHILSLTSGNSAR